MLKKYSFVVFPIAFLCAYKAWAMNETPSHLDAFPEERRRGWITRLTEPLESLITEIEKNKSALSSINEKLAIGLNTEELKYDKDTRVPCERIPPKKGPFVTKPVNCAAEFLYPLLASFKKILDNGENFLSSQTVIPEKDFLTLEDFYWPFVYADHWRHPSCQDPLSQDIESWKNGEGKNLTASIDTAFTLSDELIILMSHYQELNSFLKDFGSENRANINVITIGCASNAKQQIYPWVVDFAKHHPQLKVSIDLFDKWENGRPEFLDEYQFNWEKNAENQYSFKNIQVNINTYIPLIDEAPHGSGYFTNDFHNTLAHLIRKQLENNVVIISEHTGGYTLDQAFVSLYNQINSENNDLKRRLFLATHHGWSPKAFLYHQVLCNAKITPEDTFDFLKDLPNSCSSSSAPEQQTIPLEIEKQEDGLENRLKQIKWLAPMLYTIQDRKAGEQFLKEHAEYARIHKFWKKNQRNSDLQLNENLTENYLQLKANFEESQLTPLDDVWVKHLF